MASATAVQSYLQKHKIGPLFEDLMAKVISDMPDEPLAYLSRILHMRAERKGDLKKSSPDKPWQTNSKRMQPSTKTDPLNRSGGKKTTFASTTKPEWDHRTNVKKGSTGLDDIWGDPKATRKSHDSRGARSQWQDTNDGEDVMFSAYGYSGPRRRRNDGDPLKGELGLMKDAPSQKKQESFKKYGKKQHRNAHSSQHKADLEKYIKSSQQRGRDSGFEEDTNADDEDAIELLEDESDLRREGVLNTKKSGVRMSSAARRPYSGKPAVKVSICARCANIMGGGQPSEPARGMVDRTPMTTARTERDPTEVSRSPFNVVASDDDEFESVSQVTGPRRPVWQDPDQKAVTPRKGKSMLASNLSPTKGLPMYSSSGKTSRGPFQSEDYTHGQSSPESPVHLNKTWSPENYSKMRDDESGAEDTRSAWQVPPDYDTDSSFYGSPGGKPKKFDRAY